MFWWYSAAPSERKIGQEQLEGNGSKTTSLAMVSFRCSLIEPRSMGWHAGWWWARLGGSDCIYIGDYEPVLTPFPSFFLYCPCLTLLTPFFRSYQWQLSKFLGRLISHRTVPVLVSVRLSLFIYFYNLHRLIYRYLIYWNYKPLRARPSIPKKINRWTEQAASGDLAW